jgi:hypothetical protein
MSTLALTAPRSEGPSRRLGIHARLILFSFVRYSTGLPTSGDVQTIKNIASDFIEAQKEVIGSFQSQVDRNSGGVWDVYNPQRIAENHAVMVNNFTSYLLNTSNLINNALASNMRVYNTALEQTRDNLKNFAKTNTNYIQSVNRQNLRKF